MNTQLGYLIFLLHLLPSIINSVFFLAVVNLSLYIFKIKNPAVRCLFYTLPLLRSLHSLIKGTAFLESQSRGALVSFSLKIYDPLNLFPKFPYKITEEWLHMKSSALFWAITIGVSIALVVIFIRWIGLYLFYHNLSRESQIGTEDAPKLFATFEDLCKKFNIRTPKVVLTHKKYATPVIVGIRKPTLVVSPNLLQKLSSDSVRMLLAHELAHIKRKDNFLHWLAMGVRDFLFFNPLAHYIVRLIIREKEKAADQLAIRVLGSEPDNMLNLVSTVHHFLQGSQLKPMPAGGTPLAPKHLIFKKGKTTQERIKWLQAKQAKQKLTSLQIAGYVTLYAVIIWLQITIAIPLWNHLYIIS